MTQPEQLQDSEIIGHTKNWLEQVVIGLNFCPFAGREFRKGSIHYIVLNSSDRKEILTRLALEFHRLDDHPEIETTLIILPGQFPDFNKYLDIIELCQDLLEEEDYEGIYQVASFHPDYRFAGAAPDDPANFTNRSIYPMLHLLREESIERVLENYRDPDSIPANNIAFAKQKGFAAMEALRNACLVR